jgi:hypothetical protein
MIARHLRLMVIVATALVASACQNAAPPMQKLPDISFSHLRPFQIDVGQLEIVSEYASPGRAPNIEHLMQTAPAAAAQRWAQDRLKPMGRAGIARVVIKDGAVTETGLATDKGLSGAFKKEQELRYEGTLEVAVQILDARQMVIGETVARATRSRTLVEGATLNQRDQAQHEITEALAKDIDEQMTQLIRSYLGRWLIQ